MPYTVKNPPDTIKNLPKGAISIWVSTFNAVAKEASEGNARKAAWSNVKKKYKKIGDKWVKKTTESTKMKLSINASNFVRFQESEQGKKPIYRIIQPGLSENNFYYTDEVLEQLVPFIEQKPMLFADHLEPKDKKNMVFGQKLKDGVAVAEKVWYETGEGVLVTLESIKNPKTEWIWEQSQKTPELIGLSIDAYGKVGKKVIEDKQVNNVEQFVGYDSTDFVYQPSAGGKFMNMTEAVIVEDEDFNDSTILSVEEAAGTFEDVVKKRQNKSLFWNIGYYLTDFLYSISWDESMTDEEKEKAVENAIQVFVDKIKEIDVLTLFNKSIDDLDFGEKLKIIESQLKEDHPMSDKKVELKEALAGASLDQLKVANPELYNSIIESVKGELATSQLSEEAMEIKKENEELLEKIGKLDEKVKDLTESNNTLNQENDEFKQTQEKEKWSKRVDELITESEISLNLVTDTFKEQLLEKEKEEDVNALLEDRKAISTSKSNPAINLDNGRTKTRTTEKTQKNEVDKGQLVSDIKSN